MISVSGLCVLAGTFRLSRISFDIPAGSHAMLMGPSGAGKTTALEAICGLRRIESGQIFIAGRNVTRLPPAARKIGFVPQEGALFPHLTVRGNVAFALGILGQSSDAIAARVHELAGQFGITALLDRPVTDLSGGEKQRIALARALAARPPVLLLDEPLSALDATGRESLRVQLQRLREEENMTLLHVTHDQTEAKALGTMVIEL